MDKKDVAEIFKYVIEVYPEFEFTEGTIKVWQENIYFMRKEEVYKCLKDHILNSQYPPKISDIYTRWHGNMHPKSDHKAGD